MRNIFAAAVLLTGSTAIAQDRADAQYCPSTGELIMSANNIINIFVAESRSVISSSPAACAREYPGVPASRKPLTIAIRSTVAGRNTSAALPSLTLRVMMKRSDRNPETKRSPIQDTSEEYIASARVSTPCTDSTHDRNKNHRGRTEHQRRAALADASGYDETLGQKS